MNTTKKEFKEQVQSHILECMEAGAWEYGIDEKNIEAQLKNVVSEFNDWYSPFEQKRTPSIYIAFTEFLQGLPSCLSVEFTNYGIYETLKEWFESCGVGYKEQISDKEATLYYHLITREFKTLCKKYNVDSV